MKQECVRGTENLIGKATGVVHRSDFTALLAWLRKEVNRASDEIASCFHLLLRVNQVCPMNLLCDTSGSTSQDSRFPCKTSYVTHLGIKVKASTPSEWRRNPFFPRYASFETFHPLAPRSNCRVVPEYYQAALPEASLEPCVTDFLKALFLRIFNLSKTESFSLTSPSLPIPLSSFFGGVDSPRSHSPSVTNRLSNLNVKPFRLSRAASVVQRDLR